MSILEIVLLSYSISLALSITLAFTLPTSGFRDICMFVVSLLLPWFIVISLIETVRSKRRAKRMERIHEEMRARDQVEQEAKKEKVEPNGK